MAEQLVLDSNGVNFDPSIHSGLKKKDGGWAKLKGKKAPKVDRLAALETRIAQQDAEITRLARMTQPAINRELAEMLSAQRELSATSAKTALGTPSGPVPALIPYVGMVQAIELCHYEGLRAIGDVFNVAVKALWSDDPYSAVTVKGLDVLGKPITEPNSLAPTPIDFRFRPRSHEFLADANLIPGKASSF